MEIILPYFPRTGERFVFRGALVDRHEWFIHLGQELMARFVLGMRDPAFGAAGNNSTPHARPCPQHHVWRDNNPVRDGAIIEQEVQPVSVRKPKGRTEPSRDSYFRTGA